MRRHDKEATDPAALEAVLQQAEWGTLGLQGTAGRPMLVPLNFLFFEGRIYFHGAPAGEKMERLAAGADATFLVVDPYALIPSYAFDPVRACPASQYFKSVLAYGRVEPIHDPERKAVVLEALMRKLQPEGGYEPIRADSPAYKASLQGVAVLEFTIAGMTGKFGLGQNLKPEVRENVEAFLEQRGCPLDQRTLEAMRGFRKA
jgi:uncharacterized protein